MNQSQEKKNRTFKFDTKCCKRIFESAQGLAVLLFCI